VVSHQNRGVVAGKMRIPGTTIDVSLKVNRVYVAHEGVAKKVKYSGRSFQDVLEEVQRFAYLRGANVPATILKFILKRVGIPEVDVIPGEDELTKEDLLELSRALTALDSLKDEFLSSSGTGAIPEDIKRRLITTGTEMEEVEEPTPMLHVETPDTVWDLPQSEEVTGLIYSFHSENLPTSMPTPRTESKPSEAPKAARFLWDDPEAIAQLPDDVPAQEVSAEVASEILDLKSLFLGEKGVGVGSILFECNLRLGNDYESLGLPESRPFVYSNIVEHEEKSVRLDAWSFQKSMDAKVPRGEFYTGTGVVVIVYSVADRWSFDSLDFWIREVTNEFLIPPPIIVVGNKTDLRDHPVYGDEDDEFEVPVTTEEARSYCEEMAMRFGENGVPHPITFMETSSVTGQGVTDLLHKIVETWLANEMPSMPAVEQNVPTH
jgi:GTPase SAR1 family protein